MLTPTPLPMFSLLVSLGVFAGLWFLHGVTRGYVARRLRYVDAIQKPAAPIVAGVIAAVVAAPVVAVLPFVGAGTAIATGLTVGLGVFQGARDGSSGYLPR